jgi:hypothetical protein
MALARAPFLLIAICGAFMLFMQHLQEKEKRSTLFTRRNCDFSYARAGLHFQRTSFSEDEICLLVTASAFSSEMVETSSSCFSLPSFSRWLSNLLSAT